MKKIELSEVNVYISSVYKRKHSKRYNAAMFSGVEYKVSKDIESAEDMPDFALPMANQDAAQEILVASMIERLEDKNGVELPSKDFSAFVEDLTQEEYTKLLEVCQEVVNANTKAKVRAKKS